MPTDKRPSPPGSDRSPSHPESVSRLDRLLESESAETRIAWALSHCGRGLVVSSSFGAQAAATLHLVTRQRAGVPVIVVDTGYLFPETHQFMADLTATLDLNLKVYRPRYSSDWQETRLGRLWDEGVHGIEAYNRINKIEPMRRALRELGATGWIAGIRRNQSLSRSRKPIVQARGGLLKIHPIADWSDRDIHRYLLRHGLPYHPLWHRGYVSIGDTHTTRPLGADLSAEDTRFFGLKRECGLHDDI